MRVFVARSRLLPANVGARRDSFRIEVLKSWLIALEYSCAIPSASRRSSLSVWSCANERNSCTAIAVVTSAATRIPPRKISGRRTRSDENTPLRLRRGGVFLRLADRCDLVADTPDRHDRRRIPKLAPQLPDVHVDRARVARERIAPDALEQLVARQHEPAVVEQLPEQVELLRRELDFPVAHVGLVPARVDAQVAVDDHLGLVCVALRRGAAQDRLDPRDQLAWIERLRQVVEGADLEPDDLVDVLVAGGQHQDREVGRLPNPLADLDAVDVGEHQVEHDERRLLDRDLGEGVLAGRRRLHRVPRVLQVERDERGDRALVLDDEDRRGGRRHQRPLSFARPGAVPVPCLARPPEATPAAGTFEPLKRAVVGSTPSSCAAPLLTLSVPSSAVPRPIATTVPLPTAEMSIPVPSMRIEKRPFGSRKRMSEPE